METKKKDTKWMVSVALMAAIVIVLANTPLGMIQLPIIKATTVHIPVIIGAVLFGPLAGAILGGVFGICSLISNTMAPTLLSFAFSPFLSTTGIPGVLKALDFYRMPYLNRCCGRMALDSAGEVPHKPDNFTAGSRICRFYGKHHRRNGQHLLTVCTTVC